MTTYRQNKDANWKIPYVGGWCEGYVEGAWGQATLPTVSKQSTSGVWTSAIAKWNANPGKGNHPNELPPKGKTVAVYFSLGSTPAGHTAISLDDGMVASSTQSGFHTQGFIHPTLQNLIDVYAKYNNGCHYLGWSEYVGNIRVVEPILIETAAQVNKAYLDILGRAADAGGITHYTTNGMTDAQVRADLLASNEYKTVLANRAAQAAAITAAQIKAATAAQAAATAAAKAKADAEARQKIIDAQAAAQAVTADVQNKDTNDKVTLILSIVQWIKDLLSKIFK